MAVLNKFFFKAQAFFYKLFERHFVGVHQQIPQFDLSLRDLYFDASERRANIKAYSEKNFLVAIILLARACFLPAGLWRIFKIHNLI